MSDDALREIAFGRAKQRLTSMERATRLRDIVATKIEPQENGGVDNFVEGASPYLELYWSLEVGGEDGAAAEFCLWFMDNPDHEHSHCLYLTYSGAFDTWEFGFERDADAKHGSPKAERLAAEAFGFKEPGTREVCEAAALSIINALCAGFASTLPKKKT